MKKRAWHLIGIGLLTAVLAGGNTVGARAAGPSSITPADKLADDLRAQLAEAQAELAAVRQELLETEREIAQLEDLIQQLKRRYALTGDPNVLGELRAATADLVRFVARRNELRLKANDLQTYIAMLMRMLAGNGFGISVFP